MVLFNVHLKGIGQITITTHYEAVTLCVTPGNSVIKGPNATVFGLKIYSRSFNGFSLKLLSVGEVADLSG